MIATTIPSVTFLERLLSPPNSTFSNNLLLIGTSEKGLTPDLSFSPAYVHNRKSAKAYFGSGRLVEAYNEAYSAGARNIYLLRINKDGETFIPSGELLNRLEIVYSLIQSLPFHIIVPLDVFLEDEINDTSLALQFASFLHNKESKSIGIIGARSQSADGLLSNSIMNNKIKATSGSEMIDISYYLSVVPQLFAFTLNNERYIANASASYAGMLSSLGSEVSSTNKPLLGVDRIETEFPKEKINDLVEIGYVIFRESQRRGIVPIQGNTMAHPSSPFSSVSCVRVLHEAVSRIQSYVDMYIGEEFGKSSEVITEAANKELLGMVKDGKIKSFSVSPKTEGLHDLHLHIEIVPIGEILSIGTDVQFEI